MIRLPPTPWSVDSNKNVFDGDGDILATVQLYSRYKFETAKAISLVPEMIDALISAGNKEAEGETKIRAVLAKLQVEGFTPEEVKTVVWIDGLDTGRPNAQRFEVFGFLYDDALVSSCGDISPYKFYIPIQTILRVESCRAEHWDKLKSVKTKLSQAQRKQWDQIKQREKNHGL